MEANWSNGEECWKVAATSRRSNVATLGQPLQKSTIRNVATPQRRDVSTGSAPPHFKHQWFRLEGIGGRTNEGLEFQSSSDTRLRRSARDLYCFSFFDIIRMFLRLNIFIFSFSMF